MLEATKAVDATTTTTTTTTATIQQNVKPNDKDVVVVVEKEPSPESERHVTTYNNHDEETTEIIPKSDKCQTCSSTSIQSN
mmetsp:Transcript_25241/g.45703  ORF Transcript_25241/g.45703 Transcript_25241/m.45703 type:complete len:81 (-) Transcript_25241:512-754(-)